MVDYNLNGVVLFKKESIMYYIGKKQTTNVSCFHIYNTGILRKMCEAYNMFEKKVQCHSHELYITII